VFQVRHKVTQHIFAMKVLKKKHVLAKNQVDCARVERNVMVKVHHPFLVGLKCAFQSKDKVGFCLAPAIAPSTTLSSPKVIGG